MNASPRPLSPGRQHGPRGPVVLRSKKPCRGPRAPQTGVVKTNGRPTSRVLCEKWVFPSGANLHLWRSCCDLNTSCHLNTPVLSHSQPLRIRARLQPCHSTPNKDGGFSPWGPTVECPILVPCKKWVFPSGVALHPQATLISVMQSGGMRTAQRSSFRSRSIPAHARRVP
jgi:hypothetical protein